MNSTYECIECGIECKTGRSKVNKYCNNVCKGIYEYKHKHVPLILEGKKTFMSVTLKRFVLERDNHECQECGQGNEWLGKPLTLQMDHVDGDRQHNHPDNLKTMCPNCHVQTHTWGNKTRKGNSMRQREVPN